ncbi:MAG: SH3 domain-containing protein [Clostridia bacterium]|jgi:beta-N-acetylglucosaminidase|nr:SH3 domain-containing protein [Clostridia bacterium]
MKTKENKIKITLKSIIFSAFTFFIILYFVLFYNMYFQTNKTYAKEVDAQPEEIKISNANKTNIDEIINKNIENENAERIEKREEILEYLTEYKTNKNLPKGISYVVQEGREGKQEITTKYTYNKEGNLISEEQIEISIIKSSANKIVEIGGANYTNNYKVKKGDTIYVTSDILALWSEATEQSRKITTLRQSEEIKILEIIPNWYKISYQNMTGWIKSECTTYINLKSNKEEQYKNQISEKTKQQLLSGLGFNMQLNKPSGLTLEQFKKVLSDSKDINKIFSDNAEYFYYIEKQYNINGIFVAAVGIHESAWGTSKIALQKNNLFGYGAYDSSPYNSAYTYNDYSQSIDLIARVFVKYYLNPKGTSIYGGEIAVGTYYNGPTLTGVNTRYATDKNWANAVFLHMKYLYNKL